MRQLLFTLACSCLLLFNLQVTAQSSSGCSDAGTASASEDSICTNGNSSLLLTGYSGAIQWQSYDGTNWNNETGPGATTDNYQVFPLATTEYRAIVTLTACPPDTGNTVLITVGISSPTTTGDTRCGYGQVTLTASSSGGIKWYDVPTGGTALASGNSFSPNVASTTTFYAAATSNGGGSGTTPMPLENSTFPGMARGYFFTAPSNFNITGLFVPGTGTTQNVAVIKFVPAVPPPFFATVTNDFTVLFLAQNDPSSGFIPCNISIQAGDIIGVLGTRGPGDINSYATSPAITDIDGTPVTISRMGMQFPLSTNSPIDIWQEAGGSISRVEITYEVGCESSRTPAVATVTPADTVTINASALALCQGQSATLNANSSNSNYTYTWSPATGLSGTTGSSVTATPLTPTTYTVIAVDGNCGFIDSVFINVGPASVLGTPTISSDTICSGSNAILSVTGYTGSLQWQSFDGTNWINETGPGNNTDLYTVSPSSNMQYQLVVTSGGCASVTSSTFDLFVLTIVDPIAVNDTICDPGQVNLQANGAGVINWFTTPTGGSSINNGSNYSPTLNTTTTFYAEASAGASLAVGPINGGIGSLAPMAGNDFGISFDVTQQVTLEKVYVSPGGQNGNVTVNLRATMGGPILNTVTQGVTSFSGLTAINLGFTINPGTGYRLELETGSVECYYNQTGAVYPYTAAGSPITITGYLNPNQTTGQEYYFFYNWIVMEGCKSNRVPVTGYVQPQPTVPTISQQWNILTSSSPTGNQWYLNGVLIPGATDQVYVATQAGTYTVVVSDPMGFCNATSLPVLSTGISDDPASAGISVYPNPANETLTVNFATLKNPVTLTIYNVLGEIVISKLLQNITTNIDLNIAPGQYALELNTGTNLYTMKIVKM